MRGQFTRRVAATAAGLLLSAAIIAARPQPAQQQTYEPKVGMPGKDVVWVPTPMPVVEKMLDLARVTAADFVVDLGSGDGRNVIAAARRGARALGVEYNADMVELSRRLAREAGVGDRAAFVRGDMFEADFSKATVLALFLLPGNLEKLKDRILAMPPGTRMVVNTFTVEGWEPDESVRVDEECQTWCDVLLHIVPARVAGVWRGGGSTLALEQEFQRVTGSVAEAGSTLGIEEGRLRGDRLTFKAGGVAYEARVEGSRMTGTATREATGASRRFTLTRVPERPVPQG